MAQLVSLFGATDRLYVVEPGVHDDRALRAFTEGQCHGIALAVHRRTDWQLVAIDNARGVCDHVCVRDPEGRLVDIRGFHAAGEMPVSNGRTLRDVDWPYVAALVGEDWAPADPEAAEPWVEGLLARGSEPVVPMPVRFARTMYPAGAYELRIVWDGEVEIPACVRLPSRSVRWAGYDGVGVSRDPGTGRGVIDFTEREFMRITDLACREFDPIKADRALDVQRFP